MGLLDKLKELNNDQVISMHVPGHKNLTIGYLKEINMKFDMTEIPGLDDLHDPENTLLKLNHFLSEKYSGYQAQAMVNGSTTGILASIYAVNNKVDCFFIVGDAHKSVYHALDILKASFFKIEPEEIYSVNSHACVILTHPTYLGEAFKDLDKTINFVHSIDSLVIVDEAHGAHNDVAEGFLASSMNDDADVVIQSYHKMLPALTGASVIFVNDPKIMSDVRKYIDYFETSSPSYLIMASIELAQNFYNNFKAELFLKKRCLLIQALFEKDFKVIECDDPAKILITHQKLMGYELDLLFRNKDIYSEMVADDKILWCLPLFHQEDDFPFSLLIKKIHALDLNIQMENVPNNIDIKFLMGKKCIRSVIPYPPGVPLVFEGESFNAKVIETLYTYLSNHVKIEGIKENINYYMNEDR